MLNRRSSCGNFPKCQTGKLDSVESYFGQAPYQAPNISPPAVAWSEGDPDPVELAVAVRQARKLLKEEGAQLREPVWGSKKWLGGLRGFGG